MIFECYTADVYCDREDCKRPYSRETNYTRYDTYVGKNKKETDRERKLDGWVKKDGLDICPWCQRKEEL